MDVTANLSLGDPLEPARKATAEMLQNRERTFSLPQPFYNDERLFEIDMQEIFQKEWLIAGMTCEIPTKGNFLTLQVGKNPIIVIRGADGVDRAGNRQQRADLEQNIDLCPEAAAALKNANGVADREEGFEASHEGLQSFAGVFLVALGRGLSALPCFSPAERLCGSFILADANAGVLGMTAGETAPFITHQEAA